MTDKDLNKIGTLIDNKLAATEKRILTEIGNFVDDQLFSGKTTEFDNRVTKIESIPLIAHQLKLKKKSR